MLIQFSLKGIGPSKNLGIGMGWILVAQDSVQYQTVLNTVLYLRVPRSKNEWSYTFTLPIRLHGVVS